MQFNALSRVKLLCANTYKTLYIYSVLLISRAQMRGESVLSKKE